MTESTVFGQVFTGIGVLVLVTLVAGQAMGQPVLLSYVETESMSPTMEPGDGFIPVPTQVAGPIEEGDVITFEAQELHGGGLTTHRVVGETDRGYITQGDGNPFADQDNMEPPVKEPQIAAKALTVNGEVVVIPRFGTGVEAVQSVLETGQQEIGSLLGTGSSVDTRTVGIGIFLVTLVWYVVGGESDEKTQDRDRSRETGLHSRLVVAGCALLLISTATAAMVVPAGSHEYGVVSASFDSERPDVIPQGESSEVPYPVDNGGLVPIVSYIEPASDGIAVEPTHLSVKPRTVQNATVTLHAPPETGYYRRYITEYRYLAVLPTPVIRGLHAIHPWAPIVAIDLLIGGVVYLGGRTLLSSGRLRDRSRPHTGFRARLQRLLSDDDRS